MWQNDRWKNRYKVYIYSPWGLTCKQLTFIQPFLNKDKYMGTTCISISELNVQCVFVFFFCFFVTFRLFILAKADICIKKILYPFFILHFFLLILWKRSSSNCRETNYKLEHNVSYISEHGLFNQYTKHTHLYREKYTPSAKEKNTSIQIYTYTVHTQAKFTHTAIISITANPESFKI